MGKKKSPKILIVGDNSELHKMLAEQEIFFAHKPITISQCKKALKVASRHPSYFDFLYTDILTFEVDGQDFAKQFARLSPKTQIVYTIL